jgi:hypothetical protein
MTKLTKVAPERSQTSPASRDVATTGPPTMSIEREWLAALRVARALGATALLVVGGVHLQQYTVAHFSVIPTIGPLFLVNFIAATSLGLALLVPIRGSARLRRVLLHSVVALAGINVAAGALAALLVSEERPLFGFMEHGYRLEIVVAIVAEALAIVALCVVLVIADRWVRELRKARLARDAADTTASSTTAVV